MSGAGGRLLAEIREQPSVVQRLLHRQRATIERLALEAMRRQVRFVVVVARGTSDHAAIYGQYVLGLRNRLAVALAAPSLTTLYGVTPRYEDALVVGISQSGLGPDVVAVLAAARAQGALTAAMTNDRSSSLARVAEHVVELEAGRERSVAATKTYTAELTAVAMLSASLADDGAWTDLAALPDAMSEALGMEDESRRVAADQGPVAGAVVLGRGLSYPTAKEWGLKLKEIAAVGADAWSAADFAHGPRVLLRPGTPVFACVPAGDAGSRVREDLASLTAGEGSDVLVLSGDPRARDLGRWALTVPGVAAWLEPIVAIIPAQLHALALAGQNGVDPERPRGLAKVTRTT